MHHIDYKIAKPIVNILKKSLRRIDNKSQFQFEVFINNEKSLNDTRRSIISYFSFSMSKENKIIHDVLNFFKIKYNDFETTFEHYMCIKIYKNNIWENFAFIELNFLTYLYYRLKFFNSYEEIELIPNINRNTYLDGLRLKYFEKTIGFDYPESKKSYSAELKYFLVNKFNTIPDKYLKVLIEFSLIELRIFKYDRSMFINLFLYEYSLNKKLNNLQQVIRNQIDILSTQSLSFSEQAQVNTLIFKHTGR